MRVFSAGDVGSLIMEGSDSGFRPVDEFTPNCRERVTEWCDVRFTFGYLILQRT